MLVGNLFKKLRLLTHTGAWKLYAKCAIWLLLIHRGTARSYQGEISYKPGSPNQCSVPCSYKSTKSVVQLWARSDSWVANASHFCFFLHFPRKFKISFKRLVHVSAKVQLCRNLIFLVCGLVTTAWWLWTRYDKQKWFRPIETCTACSDFSSHRNDQNWFTLWEVLSVSYTVPKVRPWTQNSSVLINCCDRSGSGGAEFNFSNLHVMITCSVEVGNVA